MHDNSRKSSSVDFCPSSSLDADRFTADHSDSSAHISLLKFSDASDSDSSGESEEKSKLFSRACTMRDVRKPKVPNKTETWKDGKRYVDGERKEVRFSVDKNVCIDLECREGEHDIYYQLTNTWETHDCVTVIGASEPYPTALHDLHEYEGGADQSTDWDSLPDFTELAGACRFRDGREKNPFGAPAELYPYLAITLAYCRAKLLRKNVCDFNLEPNDHVPVVDGPGAGASNDFEFKEKTLDFFFGKRRET